MSFADATPSAARRVGGYGATDTASCGTAGNPNCATIDYAIASSGPGTEILVSAGTWTVGYLGSSQAGTATAPRFLRPAEEGARVTIVPPRDPGTGEYKSPLNVGSSYWVFDGLVVDCQDRPGMAGLNAVGANHVALRNSVVTRCPHSGVEVRGRTSSHLLIEGNTIRENRSQDEHDSNGITIASGAKYVVIRNNQVFQNSSDGIQCQGREQDANPNDLTADPSNIIISENEIHDDSEEAIDIKSCTGVTISNNRIFGEDFTMSGTNKCGGAAVILHYGARKVLIDSNRISNSGGAIVAGNEYMQVEDVVMKRNLIYAMNQDRIATLQGDDHENCGEGITLFRVRRADVYHNTFDDIPYAAVRVGPNSYYRNPPAECRMFGNGVPCTGGAAESVRVWNNVMTGIEGVVRTYDPAGGPDTVVNGGGVLEVWLENAPSFYADSNHYWGSAATPKFHLGTGWPEPTFRQVDFAAWKQATGLDVTSAAQSVGFIGDYDADVYGYPLKPGSSAINSAIADEGNAADMKCGGAPDRGARESDCPAPPPMPAYEAGPRLTWTKQRGSASDDFGTGVATDRSRNVFVSCTTHGGYGYTAKGGADACIQAFDYAGRYKWSRLIGTGGADGTEGVSVDDAGNVYIAGYASGPLATVGEPYHGGVDCLVAKYDPNGNRKWIAQIGTTANDACNAVVASPDGSVFVGGTTFGSFPGYALTGVQDAFLARLSTNGSVAWLKQFGLGASDGIEALARAQDGGVVAAGSQLPCVGCDRIPLVRQYDAAGNVVWDAAPSTSMSSSAWAVANAGPNRIAVIVSWHPGNEGMALTLVEVRDAATGELLWTREMGDGVNDSNDRIVNVAGDSYGNVYVVGETEYSWFDLAYDTEYPFTADAVLASFTPDGIFRWGRQLGTAADERLSGIAIDEGDRILVSGSTEGSFAAGSKGGFDFITVKY